MLPFRGRDQKLQREQLRERVKDAAVEAAQNAPERVRELSGTAREAAREAAQNAPDRVRGLSDAAREAAQNAPERLQELRKAASQLDIPWARSAPARWIRENFLTLILGPIMDYYMARRSDGYERIATLDEPVILVANHSSHVDTPVILSALPRKLRKHTAVAAAADYFYKNKILASAVALFFGTVPLDRKGGGGLSKNGSNHLDKLLNEGWNLLLYPEGSRKEHGARRVRRGAAVLASEHHMPIVPIRVSGTAEAMPPGQMWPKRLRGRFFSKRHHIQVTFGEPILPQEDTAAMIDLVQNFFDSDTAATPSRSPYLRRKASGDDEQ